MNNKVGLLSDELKAALENVSGKKLDGNYQTTAEMLHAFNNSYKCKVTFDVLTAELEPVEAVVTVRTSDGVEIAPESDGKFNLDAGSYKYDCIADGYTPKTNVALTISETDVTNGTKSVTVTMSAAS